MEQTKPSQSLPDNAYRELKPGEEYVPMMPADAKPKEVTQIGRASCRERVSERV